MFSDDTFLRFRFTRDSRDRLRDRIVYRTARPLDEHWQIVRAYLDATPEIGRDDLATLLGLSPVQASRILSHLYNEGGALVPVGKPRGRGVRYRLPDPV
jgi:transcription initiation factor IIE alpha subunit